MNPMLHAWVCTDASCIVIFLDHLQPIFVIMQVVYFGCTNKVLTINAATTAYENIFIGIPIPKKLKFTA
jgi:hypothetical protein